MKIEPEKTAVLALHLMRDVVQPDRGLGAMFGSSVADQHVLEHTSDVIAAARAAGGTVAYARVVFPKGYEGIEPRNGLYGAVMDAGILQEGSDGLEIVDAVAPRDGDLVIDHLGTSAFFGGELERQLRERGIDTVVLGGVATNVIVEGTAREAANLGFWTYVLSDCCVAGDEATHEASLGTLGMLTSGVVTSKEFIAATQATTA